jgi:hypothetical protein
MTVEEAAALKITFGKKNKGKTLGEIFKTDQGWITWYMSTDKKDPVIVSAINILNKAVEESQKIKKSKEEKTDNIDSQGSDDEFLDDENGNKGYPPEENFDELIDKGELPDCLK